MTFFAACPSITNSEKQAKKFVLIDGGVDSLIKGDENQQGTLIEDVLNINYLV
jgi:hypothetical protein